MREIGGQRVAEFDGEGVRDRESLREIGSRREVEFDREGVREREEEFDGEMESESGRV